MAQDEQKKATGQDGKPSEASQERILNELDDASDKVTNRMSKAATALVFTGIVLLAVALFANPVGAFIPGIAALATGISVFFASKTQLPLTISMFFSKDRKGTPNQKASNGEQDLNFTSTQQFRPSEGIPHSDQKQGDGVTSDRAKELTQPRSPNNMPSENNNDGPKW